jgi:hypothetical protein
MGELWRRTRWPAIAALLLGTVIGLVGIDAALTAALVHKHLEMKWGTPFEAFAAVGTVGGLAWALTNGLQLRAEANKDRRARDDEKLRDQARRITAWLDNRPGWSGFRIGNSSSEAVFEVAVYYVWMHTDRWHTTGERAEEIGREDPPMNSDSMNMVRTLIRTLPPGNFRIDVDRRGMPDNEDADARGLEIAFTDAGGNHWVRRSNGSLARRHTGAIEHYQIPMPIRYRELQIWER